MKNTSKLTPKDIAKADWNSADFDEKEIFLEEINYSEKWAQVEFDQLTPALQELIIPLAGFTY